MNVKKDVSAQSERFFMTAIAFKKANVLVNGVIEPMPVEKKFEKDVIHG